MNAQALHLPKLVELGHLALAEIVVRIHMAVTQVKVWAERSRQRRKLLELDEYRLRDIGLTREQAEAEARRPFWD